MQTTTSSTWQSNPQLELAHDYVCYTNKNIFLTGKAGTGKTTFLNQLKQEPLKRMAVVAPTGVAAINAGGMTIHSFFQLPFGPYVPGAPTDASRQRRFSRDKIKLIQSLDLLVIDEISMVRADLLDSIDEVLRRYRNPYLPFGGVQLLMIGDLHQLPPVVKDEEWDLLRPHYATPYFFSSLALQKTDPVAIELKHIYRQSDETFIQLLNKVRNNQLDEEVLHTLNSRYIPNFEPPAGEAYITLTAHNATAQAINAQELAAIPGQPQVYKARIDGDFPEHAYPTDQRLELKVGAQVMFVKNDLNPEKRYYNGKIGEVTRIVNEAIYVRCPGDLQEIGVEMADWQNVKYTLDEKTREVTEDIVGVFSQYPLKLAWAITIHKSQGLTFERAIIDAQAAFAHGQVYVALSRCKSFEGMVLRTRIAASSVKTDATVRAYSSQADQNAPDEASLHQSKVAYQRALISELFDFDTLRRHFIQLNRVFLEHENTLHAHGPAQLRALAQKAETEVWPVADKFRRQLHQYFAQPGLPEDNPDLQDRLRKAATWFAHILRQELLSAAMAIPVLTDNKAVRKTAADALTRLQKELFAKCAVCEATREGFVTIQYLRAKAHAELDFQAAESASPAKSQQPAHLKTSHPELYARLLRWRENTAAQLNVNQFGILPTISLLEVVVKMPTNMGALKKIKGIGASKSQQFGAEILHLVQTYAQEQGLALDLADAPPSAQVAKKDTKLQSFELWQAGKSIPEIAAERALTTNTIENHLAHFVGRGELDVFTLIDRHKVETIEAFFRDHDTRSTSEAKAFLGDAYTYGEIRLVLKYLDSLANPAG